MKQYNSWQAMLLAFASPKLYRDVAMRWTGNGLLYLFLLLATIWLPSTILHKVQFDRFNQQYLQPYLGKMPALMVTKDRLVLNAQHKIPYTIRDKQNKPVIIFDNTGKYQNFANTSAKLIWQNTRVMWRVGRRVYVRDVSHAQPLILSPRTIQTRLQWFSGWGFMLMYLKNLLYSFVIYMVLGCVLGLFGLGFSKVLKRGLGYRQCMRLAIVALTPMLWLGMLIDLWFSAPLSFLWIYFLLALVYLSAAIAAQAERAADNSTSNKMELGE